MQIAGSNVMVYKEIVLTTDRDVGRSRERNKAKEKKEGIDGAEGIDIRE